MINVEVNTENSEITVRKGDAPPRATPAEGGSERYHNKPCGMV